MLFINLTTKFSVVCSLKLGASFIKISSLQKVQLFSLESERSTRVSNIQILKDIQYYFLLQKDILMIGTFQNTK